jgi:hypothetical protein
MAAEASACWGPMRSARIRVRGGARVGSEVLGPVCMKITVRPVDTSVAETLSALSTPLFSVRVTARQGTSRCTRRAMGETSKMPAPPPPPSNTRGRLMACRMPKPSTSSSRMFDHTSTSRRMPSTGSARCAARYAQLMAPTLVPHSTSTRGGAPRMRVSSSNRYQSTPTSYAPRAPPPERMMASRRRWVFSVTKGERYSNSSSD